MAPTLHGLASYGERSRLPSHLLFDPLSPFACVALISPHFFPAGKQPFDWLQKQRHALPILDGGLMDYYFEQEPRGINKDMLLPA